MRARSILRMLIGAAVVLNAQSALAAYIDAYFPLTLFGYNTLGITVVVEQEDIDRLSATSWSEASFYSKNGVSQPVNDSVVLVDPAEAGTFGYYLDIAGAPPVPASSAGHWHVLALLALHYFHCVVYQGIPVCGQGIGCAGSGELCEDEAEGDIQ